MGVRIIRDEEQGYSCMYCSTTMWAFGGIFYKDEDPDEFLTWLEANHLKDKNDARQYSDKELENKISDWRNKAKECFACEGTGKNFYSCCGIDMRGKDLDICPDCKEHTGWDGLKNAEDCDECKGTGNV